MTITNVAAYTREISYHTHSNITSTSDKNIIRTMQWQPPSPAHSPAPSTSSITRQANGAHLNPGAASNDSISGKRLLQRGLHTPPDSPLSLAARGTPPPPLPDNAFDKIAAATTAAAQRVVKINEPSAVMVQYATASHRPTFNSPPKSLAPITTTAHRPSFSLEPISQDPRQASHHNDLHRKRSAAPSPMPDALPQIDSPFLPHISPTPRSATPTFPFSRDSVSSYPSASSASPRSNTPTSLYSPTSPMSRTRNMSSPPIVVAFRPASRQSLHPQSNRPQTPDNPTQNFSPPIDAPIHYFRTARRVPSNSSFASCTSSSAIDSRRGSLPKFTDVPPAQGPPPSSRRKFNLWGRPSIDNLQVSRSRSSLDVSSSRLSEEPEEKERRRPSFFAKKTIPAKPATGPYINPSSPPSRPVALQNAPAAQKWTFDTGLEPLDTPTTFSPEGVSIVQLMWTTGSRS